MCDPTVYVIVTQIFSLICVAIYLYVAVDERSGRLIRFLLLAVGGAASLSFWVPVLIRDPPSVALVATVSFLAPGAWLIVPACTILAIDCAWRLPSKVRSTSAILAVTGILVQVFWMALLAMSEG